MRGLSSLPAKRFFTALRIFSGRTTGLLHGFLAFVVILLAPFYSSIPGGPASLPRFIFCPRCVIPQHAPQLRSGLRCKEQRYTGTDEGAGDEASLVFITHRAQEGAFQATLAELRDHRPVRAVESLLRVEGEG